MSTETSDLQWVLLDIGRRGLEDEDTNLAVKKLGPEMGTLVPSSDCLM